MGAAEEPSRLRHVSHRNGPGDISRRFRRVPAGIEAMAVSHVGLVQNETVEAPPGVID